MNDVHIRSIVLAEDDKDDHIFFSEALMQIDPSLKLTTVDDGNELMDLLKHYYPDILFLDLDMPYKNGLECLREIRSSETLKDLPVIVFSSTSRPVNI
ncbi:MAG TPA: response regulator, partial [Chitinophagaceae bacterium]